MRAFLKALPRGLLGGVPAAAFDTRLLRSRWLTGSAASGVARELRRLGCRLVVAPASFFVLGREGPLEPCEEERAGRWARTVLMQAEGSRAAPDAANARGPCGRLRSSQKPLARNPGSRHYHITERHAR